MTDAAQDERLRRAERIAYRLGGRVVFVLQQQDRTGEWSDRWSNKTLPFDEAVEELAHNEAARRSYGDDKVDEFFYPKMRLVCRIEFMPEVGKVLDLE